MEIQANNTPYQKILAFDEAMRNYSEPLETLDRLRAKAENESIEGFGVNVTYARFLAEAYSEIIRRRYDAGKIAAHARRQRYLAAVGRARKLACDDRGNVVLDVGGKPSFFSRVERAAWEKYIG